MSDYFRGTPDEVMSAIISDLRTAAARGHGANAYFRGALTGLVTLCDRQAVLGPADPERTRQFRHDLGEQLQGLLDELAAYAPRAALVAETATVQSNWVELCVRRSAIQLLLSDYAGTPIAETIRPADVAELDIELRRVGLELGPLPDDAAPKGLTGDHWWWRYPIRDAKPLTSYASENQRATDLDLDSAELSGADLSGLSADRLNLYSADLRLAKLVGARLGECRLERARMDQVNCTGATFWSCSFNGAQATEACFDGVRLEDSTAVGADFSGSSFRGAHLTDTHFSRAAFCGSEFKDAEGVGVEFRGADLAVASLRGVSFEEADFRGADLRGADLSGGHFHHADFRGAILDEVRFDGADCTGATFDEGQGPNLRSASNSPGADNAKLEEAVRDVLAKFTAALPIASAIAGNAPELIARLQRAAADLEASGKQPPEEWKPLLEPLMKLTQGKVSLEEILRQMQTSTAEGIPEEWREFLEGLTRKGSANDETHPPD